jgi:hypothetical protein
VVLSSNQKLKIKIGMGEAHDSDDLVTIDFHNQMWSRLNEVLQ